jgi:hypothetical protein
VLVVVIPVKETLETLTEIPPLIVAALSIALVKIGN